MEDETGLREWLGLDTRHLDDIIDWLCEQRIGSGWPTSPGGREASVTVTSETVLALTSVLRTAPDLEPEKKQKINEAIDAAISFVEEQLTTRVDLDLPNVAYAIQAIVLSGRPVTAAFIEKATELLFSFETLSQSGWRSTYGSSASDTFATCLAALTMQCIVVPGDSNLYLKIASEEVRSRYTTKLSQLLEYVFTQAPRDAETGGWYDSGSLSKVAEPAITAMVLFLRIRHLSAIGLNQRTIMDDSLCRAAISYLCIPQKAPEYVYQLHSGSYSIFYLPYIVLSMSELIQYLDETMLSYYYSMAELLAGPTYRKVEDDGNLLGWYASLQRRPDEPPIWATAHALRGYCAIPISYRELLSIKLLRGQYEQAQELLSQADGLDLLTDEFLMIGRAKFQIGATRALLILLMGIVTATGVGLGVGLRPVGVRKGLILALLFLGATALTYLMAPVKEKRAWRLAQSLALGLAALAVAGQFLP